MARSTRRRRSSLSKLSSTKKPSPSASDCRCRSASLALRDAFPVAAKSRQRTLAAAAAAASFSQSISCSSSATTKHVHRRPGEMKKRWNERLKAKSDIWTQHANSDVKKITPKRLAPSCCCVLTSLDGAGVNDVLTRACIASFKSSKSIVCLFSACAEYCIASVRTSVVYPDCRNEAQTPKTNRAIVNDKNSRWTKPTESNRSTVCEFQ